MTTDDTPLIMGASGTCRHRHRVSNLRVPRSFGQGGWAQRMVRLRAPPTSPWAAAIPPRIPIRPSASSTEKPTFHQDTAPRGATCSYPDGAPCREGPVYSSGQPQEFGVSRSEVTYHVTTLASVAHEDRRWRRCGGGRYGPCAPAAIPARPCGSSRPCLEAVCCGSKLAGRAQRRSYRDNLSANNVGNSA